jgi:transcriptional regulator with XRE-family HTH domain
VEAMRSWEQLGAALKLLREQKNFSQEEVVSKSRSYERPDSLSRIEGGHRRPPRQKLLRILVTGLEVRDILRLNEILRLANYAPVDDNDFTRDPLQKIVSSPDTPAVGTRPFPASLTRELESPEDEARNAAVISGRLCTRLLTLCYPDDELAAQHLQRYSYSLNGHQVITNLATKDSWLGLSIPIKETDANRFPLEPRSFRWPATSHNDGMRLRAELSEEGVQFHNKPIYCLQSFEPSRDPIATFSVGQYVDYKIKLGQLEKELTKALRDSSATTDPDRWAQIAFQERYSRMPFRTELLRDCRKIADFRNRLCAGGTNVLLAFRRPGDPGFAFFMERRTQNVSTGKQMFALIPSGMHQPTNEANAPHESSVAATVYREAYEELFGGKQVEGEDRHVDPLWYMSEPMLKWIEQHRASVITEIVSFGLNLVDGTYEFGVLFAITDETYWESFTRTTNEEFVPPETPVYSTMDTPRMESILLDPHSADTSLIALVEGLQRLHELEPLRVRLPDFKRDSESFRRPPRGKGLFD